MGTIREFADDWDRFHCDLPAEGGGNPALDWRWREIFRLLGHVDPRSSRILDIGCGDGALLRRAERLYPGVPLAGTDSSAVGIRIAVAKVPAARFVQVDLMAENFEPDDVLRSWASHAVCTEVVEHVDDPVGFLARARVMMASGCRLIVTVPGGPMSASDRHFGHRRHYTRGLLAAQLAEAGYAVDGVVAAGFPFHNIYRLMIMLRGRAAVGDQVGRRSAVVAASIAVLFRLFSLLFRFNLNRLPLGWQIIAVARRR